MKIDAHIHFTPPELKARLAELSEEGGADTLKSLIDRYLGQTNASLGDWLLSRSEEELALCVEIQRFFSWDYRKRMESVA